MDDQNPSQPNFQQSPPPQSLDSLHWLKILSIVLAAVLILTTVGLGAYFLGKNQSQTSTVQTSPTPDLNREPTGSAATTDWKTYISTKNGYQIKYPEHLMFEAVTYQGIGGEVTADSWSAANNAYSISVYSYPEGVNTKLEFIAKIESDENIFVAGQKARKLVGTERISDRGILIHVGPIENKGQNYMLIYTSGSQKANTDDLVIFDQILSTFRFD